jgi:hypothetical protein
MPQVGGTQRLGLEHGGVRDDFPFMRIWSWSRTVNPHVPICMTSLLKSLGHSRTSRGECMMSRNGNLRIAMPDREMAPSRDSLRLEK